MRSAKFSASVPPKTNSPSARQRVTQDASSWHRHLPIGSSGR
jgi:hypothetical protein